MTPRELYRPSLGALSIISAGGLDVSYWRKADIVITLANVRPDTLQCRYWPGILKCPLITQSEHWFPNRFDLDQGSL
jgi:hypothetical protein